MLLLVLFCSIENVDTELKMGVPCSFSPVHLGPSEFPAKLPADSLQNSYFLLFESQLAGLASFQFSFLNPIPIGIKPK